MKVCTDACLFGAMVSEYFKETGINNMLDIGTGTGLLSLMFAQKNPDTFIDAVEIDEAAAMQAVTNFQASPWKERLNIYNTSIQQFNHPAIKQYSLIVSNPPFFEKDLRSDDAKRNLALHSEELSFEELIEAAQKNIYPNGIFVVLLPFHRTFFFEELATKNNFCLYKKISVKQTPAHNYFRSVLFFSRHQSASAENEIIIKTAQNQYSPEFTGLLKDYYLNL